MGIIEDGKRHHLHYKGISRTAAEDVKKYGDFRQLDRELRGPQIKPETPHQSDEGFNPLIFQASKGDLGRVLDLLQGRKYDIDQPRYKDGDTALHVAAAGGHADVVEALLIHGADRTARNKELHTAYALAKDRGHTDTIAAFNRHEAGLELIAAAEKGDRNTFNSLMSQYAFTDRRMLEQAKERAARNEYGDIAAALTDRIAALPAPAARKPAQVAATPQPEPKKGGSMIMAIMSALGVGGAAAVLTGGLGLIPIALAAVAGMAMFTVTGSMGRSRASASHTASLPSAIPGKTAQANADSHYMPTPEFEVPSVPKMGKPPVKLPGKNASPQL